MGPSPYLVGKLATRVAAAAVNLADSPFYPGALARGFDAEGVPKQPLPLIQDGIAHAVVGCAMLQFFSAVYAGFG